jgi:hypothetical protein
MACAGGRCGRTGEPLQILDGTNSCIIMQRKMPAWILPTALLSTVQLMCDRAAVVDF